MEKERKIDRQKERKRKVERHRCRLKERESG